MVGFFVVVVVVVISEIYFCLRNAFGSKQADY